MAMMALRHAEAAQALRRGDAEISALVTRLREPLQADEVAHLERRLFETRAFDRRTGEVIEALR